jgi:hypothetical protein
VHLTAAAEATRDLTIKVFLAFIPVALICLIAAGLLVLLVLRLRDRYSASAVIETAWPSEKECILEAVSELFFLGGYSKAGEDEFSVTFVKDNRYNLVLGAVLFLFLVIPGIIYLLVCGRELLGRVSVQSIGEKHIVTIKGPRSIIDRARLFLQGHEYIELALAGPGG